MSEWGFLISKKQEIQSKIIEENQNLNNLAIATNKILSELKDSLIDMESKEIVTVESPKIIINIKDTSHNTQEFSIDSLKIKFENIIISLTPIFINNQSSLLISIYETNDINNSLKSESFGFSNRKQSFYFPNDIRYEELTIDHLINTMKSLITQFPNYQEKYDFSGLEDPYAPYEY